jgi:hypothetical protein
MTFSKHVDVMVAKAFAMLEFIRRLSLEFRDLYTLKSLYTSLARIATMASPPLMLVLAEWNACKGGLFDRLCMVWVGQTCMICHHMRTDAPFCILAPVQKGDRLLDVYFRCSKWKSEPPKLVVRSRFDHTTISDSRYRASAYERTIDFMNKCRVRCDSLI